MTHIVMILKGAAIGVATLIPGVSGGTMAIILGVYNLMIDGLSSFHKEWKKYFLPFLELGISGLCGLVFLSSLISELLKQYEIIMQFLFIGIIIGGLPTLVKKSRQLDYKQSDWTYFGIGLILVLLTALTPSALFSTGDSFSWMTFLLLFISGIIIAIALVLPGISASFLLLVLGMYQSTLQAIRDVDVLFLLPVGLGVIFGTFASAHIIKYFLEKHPSKTYLLIIGFVVGSLFELFPPLSALNGNIILLIVIVTIIGFLSTFTLSKLSKES